MGNRRSVEKALEHVGARATVTSDHERLRAAAGLVVPGVGAFPRAMENLRELGLDELLRERVGRGTPCWACAWACSWRSTPPQSSVAQPAWASCPARCARWHRPRRGTQAR